MAAEAISTIIQLMNRLEFKYTFKEFFEGTRNANLSMRILSIFGVVYIALMLFLFLMRYFPEVQGGGPGSVTSNLAPWLIGVCWVSLPLLQAWLVWRGNPSVKEVIRCWADEESFSLQTTNSDTTIKWPALIKFRETRNLFLVYPSKQICFLIPKRAFMDESQVKEFRELLHRKINRRQ
jgi:YcxB-like protein